jgi:hypothetical protein
MLPPVIAANFFVQTTWIPTSAFSSAMAIEVARPAATDYRFFFFDRKSLDGRSGEI